MGYLLIDYFEIISTKKSDFVMHIYTYNNGKGTKSSRAEKNVIFVVGGGAPENQGKLSSWEEGEEGE